MAQVPQARGQSARVGGSGVVRGCRAGGFIAGGACWISASPSGRRTRAGRVNCLKGGGQVARRRLVGACRTADGQCRDAVRRVARGTEPVGASSAYWLAALHVGGVGALGVGAVGPKRLVRPGGGLGGAGTPAAGSPESGFPSYLWPEAFRGSPTWRAILGQERPKARSAATSAALGRPSTAGGAVAWAADRRQGHVSVRQTACRPRAGGRLHAIGHVRGPGLG
jgi:hypothetical protein